MTITTAGRVNGLPLLLRGNLNDDADKLYTMEGNNYPGGQSGIWVYFWNNGGFYHAIILASASGDTNATILATNINVGINAAEQPFFNVKVSDDGAGTIKLYADAAIFATIKLSDIQSVTVDGNTYEAYRKAEVISTTASNSGSMNGVKENTLIAAENATFALVKGVYGAAETNTGYYDNISLTVTEGNVQTGDSSNVVFAVIVLILAAGVMMASVKRRRMDSVL